LLWLDDCRQREAGKTAVEGLRIYAPAGSSATLRLRMAHLNRAIARFELAELQEGEESALIDCSGVVHVDTRLLPCPDTSQAHSYFAPSIDIVRALAPACEIAVLSPAEISFRLHGLEFARARIATQTKSFDTGQEIVFGISGMEHRLTSENEAFFRDFVARVVRYRSVEGDRRNPLWRGYPERWLESLVVRNVNAVDSRLDRTTVYSQVPAFSASDRSLIDVLACTSEGRLAVLELKADEDIHLPVQGLDYWARVRWHHSRGDFQKFGYFKNVRLAPEPPLLFLVSPSLRVHPAVETLLRYFSPSIQWTLVGLDERWRDGVRVIFRKSSVKAASA
jgi:hypothetical protein